MRSRTFLASAAIFLGACSSPARPVAPREPIALATPASSPAQSVASATASPPPPLVCPPRRFIGETAFAADMHRLLTSCAGPPTICGDTSDKPGGLPEDHFADVWDLDRGELVSSLDTGLSNVRLMVSGPRHLLTTIADPNTGGGTVRVFDTQSWKQLASTDAYCIQSVVYDPEGTRLAISGADGQIHVLDTKTWHLTSRPLKDAHIGGDTGVGLQFDPKGKTLLVMDDSAGPQVVDARTLAMLRRRSLTSPLVSMTTSPTGQWLAGVTDDGALDVVDARSLKTTERARGDGWVGAAVYPLDEERFLSRTLGGETAIFTAKGTLAPLTMKLGGSANDKSSQIVLDNARTGLALVGSNGSIRFVDLTNVASSTPPIREIVPSGDPDAGAGLQLSFDPADHRLAVVDQTGGVAIWDLARARVITTLPPVGVPGPDVPGPTFDWSADGAFFFEAANGELRLLRLADGESMTVSLFEDGGKRLGVVRGKDGAYAGSRDLASCAAGTDATIGASRPSLLSDFFRGLPLH